MSVCAASAPAPRRPEAEAALPCVLLVEDDPDHAFLVSRRLQGRRLPFRLEHAVTVTAALDRLRTDAVVCVVLDLSLPDARDLQALERVRAEAPDVPVVVLTGLASEELGLRAVQLGAQDYLVKEQGGSDGLARAVLYALERTRRRRAEQARARQAAELALVLDATAEGICWVDGAGTVSWANAAAQRLLQGDAVEGRGLHAVLHPVCGPGCPLQAALEAPADADLAVRAGAGDGGRCFDVRVRALRGGGAGRSSVVSLTDVTDARRAEQALRERELQLAEAQQLASLGSWRWDPRSGGVDCSDETAQLLGLRPGQVPADTGLFHAYLGRVPAGEREGVAALFADPGAAPRPVTLRHRLVNDDGQERWVQARRALLTGPAGPTVLGTLQDVSDQVAAERALERAALHDQLTGLPNRAVLEERLTRALAARRGPQQLAVLFVDLDRFKWVNDDLGHSAGDALLRAVAVRLSGVLRPTDTLARFGGDEFVALSEEVQDEAQVRALGQRLLDALAEPFHLDGQVVTVTASAGLVVVGPGSAPSAALVLKQADAAMYRAKLHGRGQLEVHEGASVVAPALRVHQQGELRQALEDERGVLVHYQPVVDLRDGRELAVEALVRWEHPGRGLLLPAEFVPQAEDSGLVVALGHRVLALACAATAGWASGHAAWTLAVNLSAVQLAHPHLLSDVEHVLAETGFPPRQLVLELTETTVMADVDRAHEVLARVRALGCAVSVDDFGTGYSSLASLHTLPLDSVKLDRSFIARIDDASGRAVVAAATHMAAALGLAVVAEGVELEQQRDALLELGVTRGQGWLYGRAVPWSAR